MDQNKVNDIDTSEIAQEICVDGVDMAQDDDAPGVDPAPGAKAVNGTTDDMWVNDGAVYVCDDEAKGKSTDLPGLLKLPGAGDRKPLMIGVCGGSGSGKTTVCEVTMERLGDQADDASDNMAVLIHQDSFYHPLGPNVDVEKYNFDHPDVFDNELIYTTLLKLSAGQPAEIPIYDFETHTRLPGTVTINPAPVILFEGILLLYHKEWRDLFDLKLFVDCDPDTRLARRVLRDMTDRGRTLDSVLWQYVNFVKPAFEDFILPTKKYADVIIPRGANNLVAIDLIVQHIKEQGPCTSCPRGLTHRLPTFPLPSPHLSSYRPH